MVSTGIKNRLNFIDVAKGIGIILVVLGHLNSAEQPVRNFIYSFHMPFFFVVSGMFFSEKTDFKTLFIKSVKTLLVPYLIFIAVDALVYMAMNSFTTDSVIFALKTRLLSATGLRLRITNLPIWFLFALFIIRLIYHFISKNKYAEIIFVATGVLLTALAPYLWYPPKCMYIVALPCLVFYSLGHRMKNYIINIDNVKFNFVNAVIILIVAVGLYFSSNYNYCINMYSYKYGNFLLFYLNGILGSGILLVLSSWLNRIEKLSVPLIYYGRSSVVILTWHYYMCRIVLPNIMSALGLGQYLYSYLTQIIVLLCVLLIMIPIEKISGRYLGFVYGK